MHKIFYTLIRIILHTVLFLSQGISCYTVITSDMLCVLNLKLAQALNLKHEFKKKINTTILTCYIKVIIMFIYIRSVLFSITSQFATQISKTAT